MRRLAIALLCATAVTCRRAPSPPAAAVARNVVLITIDTLRADHLGAYGYPRSTAGIIDGLAATGALFEHAYAAAPITLPSHATILTGRYPPGHGARDNGMRVSADVPTLATVLKAKGFRTGAFVAAFPLDHQFGLGRGFDVYGDRMPRTPDGRLADERPASQVVDDALAWLGGPSTTQSPAPGTQHPAPGTEHPAPGTQHPAPSTRFFLWVHFFEPHAPYAGDPARPAIERYDQEIATADRQVGRLVNSLAAYPDTLVVIAGDHGEAFGEHGEIAHSIFVYDTTLRVPLIMTGPGIPRRGPGARFGAVVDDPVTLADVAPTIAHAVGAEMKDVDGIDLGPALAGGRVPARELYAESFAPLVEFGWAPLRSVRSESWKFIAAPHPELFDIARDAGEATNLLAPAASQAAERSRYEDVARRLDGRVARYSGTALPKTLSADLDPAAAERLRALGYAAGSSRSTAEGPRPDPKDRRDLAARIAQVTSGELTGAALVSALQAIVREDPGNGQAHLRLGVLYAKAGDCARGEPELSAAISSGLPSADAYLSLAACRGRRNDLRGAADALNQALRVEPDNPVVRANIGILAAARGDLPAAIDALERAVAADPDLHEARFNLAVAYARAGRRRDAEAAARTLLSRLPADAPQRPEVERLLRSLR